MKRISFIMEADNDGNLKNFLIVEKKQENIAEHTKQVNRIENI